MVTNAPNPGSLHVTEVVIVQRQISQQSHIFKNPKISVKTTANIFAHTFKEDLAKTVTANFSP